MDLFQLLASDNIHEKFDQLAHQIINNSELVINNISFDIIEIEFYIYDDKHPDIFAHRNKYQKSSMKWYFHRTSDGEHSYRSGTFKGLDITCGSQKTYGGILIRSIKETTTGKITEGPCRVVNKILELTNCQDIKELVCEKMNNNINVDNPVLFLKQKQPSANSSQLLFRSPRIGITLKKKDNIDLRKQYISKLYRYLVSPSKITKGKKMSYFTSLITNEDHITMGEFGCKKQQIDSDRQLIEKMKTTIIDYQNYVGIDLNDIQRLDLLFSTQQPVNIIKKKIQLKNLKSTIE